MNYYERHIGDYLKDTAHLTLLEHGVYSRLLDVYYTRECAIPDAQVARLIGARTKDELAAMRAVLSEFFVQEEGGDWVQMRCEREITRFQDKQRKASASATARWTKAKSQSDGNANASPDAMRTHSEGNAPNHQTPDTRESASALSARAQVGSALKAAGMDLTRVNLSDPRVDALLTAGATAEQFAGLASEAIRGKKSNAWAWLLAVMPERMATAAGVKATGHAGFAAKDYRNGVESDGTFTA